MFFTDAEIEELGERFKESLRKGEEHPDRTAPNLAEIQDWMIRHHVDHPEVLLKILGKIGPGLKAGEKKMS
ncbi:MAG: hypothetical protein HS115_20020 [Spirochaetales bacterium]|jgi:hypothetical protein|nr:hypothetical protein [Spirochaetales bacterium]MBE7438407.1 hypothetical protein [Spirochaetales bacterium]MBE7439619.1 hypothetical protein [Spirochaetales bacterium]MBE7439795.1 hypothetical protein [Spirochaetales bacterium]MBE7440012.1 hypothetical protein [Spirochaetales bacterium]